MNCFIYLLLNLIFVNVLFFPATTTSLPPISFDSAVYCDHICPTSSHSSVIEILPGDDDYVLLPRTRRRRRRKQRNSTPSAQQQTIDISREKGSRELAQLLLNSRTIPILTNRRKKSHFNVRAKEEEQHLLESYQSEGIDAEDLNYLQDGFRT